ncbi:hypothetical protein ACFLWS_04465 [Chloroflexota bacterium]
MIGVIAGRILINVYGLSRVFRIEEVKVNPLHPDKFGGLRPVNQYAMKITIFLASMGVTAVMGIVIVGLDRVDDFHGLIPLFIIYLLLSPILFFGTLATAHGPMADIKEKYQLELSDLFNKYFSNTQDKLKNDQINIAEDVGRINDINELYKITNSFPVWPFDFRSIRDFLLVLFSPAVIFVIQFNIL